MVHGPKREEVGPGEGILDFVEQEEAVRGLRQDPLAEEVTMQPLPTWQGLPVVVLRADFKQPGLDVVGEGPGQFGLPGTRWAIEEDVGPGFPAFDSLPHVPDQQAEVGVVGKILQRQGWGRRLGKIRRQYAFNPTCGLPEGLVEAFHGLELNRPVDPFIDLDEPSRGQSPILPDRQANFGFGDLENSGQMVIKFLDPTAIEFMQSLPETGFFPPKHDEQEDVPLGFGQLQQLTQLRQVLERRLRSESS